MNTVALLVLFRQSQRTVNPVDTLIFHITYFSF